MKNDLNDSLHEECAVFGVSLNSNEAAGVIYNGLLALQHRGQEGAGIATLSENQIFCQKDVGLVSEVFSSKELSKFPHSSTGVGHCRYSTTGNNTIANVQPFITEYLTGRIATCHNGNITNATEIKHFLMNQGLSFSASSDSEVISSLIAYETVKSKNIISGVENAIKKLMGAFSLIIMSSENILIALRDPWGFRPLCLGENETGIAVASESCALDSQGFSFVRDVQPGELVIIKNGKITDSIFPCEKKPSGICIFEYVYFARPDSTIDGLNVYEARYNMGQILAKEQPVAADVVCGVPDSGLEAAMGFSKASGIPMATGFVKNRYIGRSFIFPSQSQRENAVKLKLNPLRANVEGKRIVLIDDSIVRGTTSAKIIAAMRNAGAKEVHMRISSPPFRHTCHFGTDIDKEENLIANQMTIDDIRKKIGADSLGFISIEGLKNACAKSKLDFCTGCFTGNYHVQPGDETKLQLEKDT